MAAVSSLGLGSGTLTSDVIDKLKAADSSAIINPITKNIDKVTQKQTELATLVAQLSTLKSSTYDLGTDTAYLKTKASSSSTAISVTTTDGVAPQTSIMNVTQLAKNDVVQSIGFSTSSSIVPVASATGGSLTIKVGSQSSYQIKINSGTTIEQLEQSINDSTNGEVKASIINTGSSTNPYRLIIKSVKSGDSSKLSISENGLMSSIGLETPSITANSTATTTSGLTLKDGDITINGTAITGLTTSSTNSETNATQLVNMINLKTSTTGVSAITDGSGKLKLISDGRAISLSLTGNASAVSGLSSNQIFVSNEVYAGTNTATTTSPTTISGIKINGVSIDNITLNSTDSQTNAQTIADAINNTSNTGVKVTTDGAGKLKIYALDGKDISIELSNGAAAKTGLAATDGTYTGTKQEKLQNAQDAKFTYDGISMNRSSNTITDVISGATMTLNNTSATDGDATIAITQDTSSISTTASDFVKSFNDLNTKLAELTKYDPTTGKAGTFSGISEVSGIYSSISSILTTRDENNKSLMDYGFSLDKNGQLSLDSTVLDSALSSDPAALEKLFKGTNVVTKAYYTANFAVTNQSGKIVPSGSIVINGIDIGSITTTSNDAETNAQLFVSAINAKYSDTGVKAYTDGSGKIKLETPNGDQIKLQTSNTAAEYVGLSATPADNKVGLQSSTVAYGKSESKDGVFAALKNFLSKLMSNSDSILTTYDNSLTTELNNLTTQKTTAQTNLDSRYELMTSRFALYDKMIAQYQQQFSSLQMQIKQASGG